MFSISNYSSKKTRKKNKLEHFKLNRAYTTIFGLHFIEAPVELIVQGVGITLEFKMELLEFLELL